MPQVRRERANISILLQSASGRGFDLVLAFDFGWPSGYSADNSPDVILHPRPRNTKTKSQQRPLSVQCSPPIPANWPSTRTNYSQIFFGDDSRASHRIPYSVKM